MSKQITIVGNVVGHSQYGFFVEDTTQRESEVWEVSVKKDAPKPPISSRVLVIANVFPKEHNGKVFYNIYVQHWAATEPEQPRQFGAQYGQPAPAPTYGGVGAGTDQYGGGSAGYGAGTGQYAGDPWAVA